MLFLLVPILAQSIASSSCACLNGRVPALNTDPAFIKDMADIVVEALALPTLTVSEVRYISFADVLVCLPEKISKHSVGLEHVFFVQWSNIQRNLRRVHFERYSRRRVRGRSWHSYHGDANSPMIRNTSCGHPFSPLHSWLTLAHDSSNVCKAYYFSVKDPAPELFLAPSCMMFPFLGLHAQQLRPQGVRWPPGTALARHISRCFWWQQGQ